MKMRPRLPKPWLPLLAIAFGIIFSLALWYALWGHLPASLQLLVTLKDHLPWIALALGLSLSFLTGAVIRMSQRDHHRTLTLNQMNEDLKKEITERLHAEDVKQKLESSLSQGQKLQAMGTLAGGIAHDFNNILYAIIGYVEMAREEVPNNTQLHKNLGKVLDASHRGQDLISRILNFSRRQHHQFEVIELTPTIEAALSLLKPTIPASVIINCVMESHATILGNQTQIHQVLVNLINNAVDAMDGEGVISIHMMDVTSDDPALEAIPNKISKSYCKINVTDTGHGMNQRTMDRCFEPFFTTKEVGKGTGLGLSIVHTIIKEHHGEVVIKTQLGHGTTFVLLLPSYTVSS